MSVLGRIRTFIVRRHLVLFGIILAAGMSMIVIGMMMGTSALSTPDNPVLAQLLITEGVAFVVIGLVGILMSWTTFDIGTNIKDVVREVGMQNKETLDLLRQSQDRIAQSQDRIAQSQERTSQSLDRIDQSLDRIAQSQERIEQSQERTSQSLDRIAQSQERIEQSQERTSQSLDKMTDLLTQVVKNTTRAD